MSNSIDQDEGGDEWETNVTKKKKNDRRKFSNVGKKVNHKSTKNNQFSSSWVKPKPSSTISVSASANKNTSNDNTKSNDDDDDIIDQLLSSQMKTLISNWARCLGPTRWSDLI